MIRKTVSLDEELYRALESAGLYENYRSFSELVSDALRRQLEEHKKRAYLKEMEEMAKDPMVRDDIAEIEEAFRFSDAEIDAV